MESSSYSPDDDKPVAETFDAPEVLAPKKASIIDGFKDWRIAKNSIESITEHDDEEDDDDTEAAPSRPVTRQSLFSRLFGESAKKEVILPPEPPLATVGVENTAVESTASEYLPLQTEGLPIQPPEASEVASLPHDGTTEASQQIGQAESHAVFEHNGTPAEAFEATAPDSVSEAKASAAPESLVAVPGVTSAEDVIDDGPEVAAAVPELAQQPEYRTPDVVPMPIIIESSTQNSELHGRSTDTQPRWYGGDRYNRSYYDAKADAQHDQDVLKRKIKQVKTEQNHQKVVNKDLRKTIEDVAKTQPVPESEIISKKEVVTPIIPIIEKEPASKNVLSIPIILPIKSREVTQPINIEKEKSQVISPEAPKPKPEQFKPIEKPLESIEKRVEVVEKLEQTLETYNVPEALEKQLQVDQKELRQQIETGQELREELAHEKQGDDQSLAGIQASVIGSVSNRITQSVDAKSEITINVSRAAEPVAPAKDKTQKTGKLLWIPSIFIIVFALLAYYFIVLS